MVGNGGGAEIEMIGEKNNGFLQVGAPDLDAAQGKGTFLLPLNAGQRNQLITTNVSVLRDGVFFDELQLEILTKASHKEHALRDPFGPEFVVDVGAVHRNDGAALHR